MPLVRLCLSRVGRQHRRVPVLRLRRPSGRYLLDLGRHLRLNPLWQHPQVGLVPERDQRPPLVGSVRMGGVEQTCIPDQQITRTYGNVRFVRARGELRQAQVPRLAQNGRARPCVSTHEP